MNCETPPFSPKLSSQRVSQAKSLLGEKAVQKILVYALFLLGAKRSEISSFSGMPPGSIRSLVLSMNHRGLAGLEDQSALKKFIKVKKEVTVTRDDAYATIKPFDGFKVSFKAPLIKPYLANVFPKEKGFRQRPRGNKQKVQAPYRTTHHP